MPKSVVVFFCVILISIPPFSQAGKLTIKNTSNNPIFCKINYNKLQANQVSEVYVGADQTLDILPDYNFGLTINKVKCEKLEHDNIGVTPKSSDHLFIYDKRAENVLSVLLYPYIPTYPFGDYSALLKRLVTEFQKSYPAISLNAVISQAPEFDIYNFDNLPKLLGPNGFDIVELDTMLMQHLVKNNLIMMEDTNISIAEFSNNFWFPALEGASYDGKLYGVPSWLCMEFLFARDHQIVNLQTTSQMAAYLRTLSNEGPKFIGVFTGIWTMAPVYFDIFADLYGYENVKKIPYEKPDALAINYLINLADQCDYQGKNNCTNNYYHGLDVWEMPKFFAQHYVGSYIGFAESSFYTRIFDQEHKFYATPLPFGKSLNPLLYSDAFVENSSRCANHSCAAAFSAFARYMSHPATRKWIAYSEDLGSELPPRRLLPAIKKFYSQTKESDDSDGIYEGFLKIISKARAMPNNISRARMNELQNEICKMLKAQRPDYAC